MVTFLSSSAIIPVPISKLFSNLVENSDFYWASSNPNWIMLAYYIVWKVYKCCSSLKF